MKVIVLNSQPKLGESITHLERFRVHDSTEFSSKGLDYTSGQDYSAQLEYSNGQQVNSTLRKQLISI